MLSNIFIELFNLAITIAENIGKAWDFLNKTQSIGFRTNIFGFIGVQFVPLHLLGIGILTLFSFVIIKAIVPVA